MNGKIKGVLMASLMLAVAVSIIYAVPVLANMNGATDLARDRDQDRLRDQTCDCDYSQTQTQAQNCTQLRQHDCAQNQTCDGSPDCQQYQYQYGFRNGNTSTP